MKRVLAIVASVAVTAVLPLQALATCQNIVNNALNGGWASRLIAATYNPQHKAVINFKGDGYSTGGDELNMGYAKTVGYLPTGGQYNLWFSASHVDRGSPFPTCFDSTIEAIASARAGDACGAVIDGPWTSQYNVNTCGMLDGDFRGLLQIGFNGFGWTPSVHARLVVRDRTSSTPLSSSDGCYKVSTSPGAAGCSDPLP